MCEFDSEERLVASSKGLATPRISPTFLPNQESRQRSFLIASVKQEVSKQRQKIAWRRGKGRRFYAQQPL